MASVNAQLLQCTDYELHKVYEYAQEKEFWVWFKELGYLQPAALAAQVLTDGGRSASRKGTVLRYLKRVCKVFRDSNVEFLTKRHIRADSLAIINRMSSLKTEESKTVALRVMYQVGRQICNYGMRIDLKYQSKLKELINFKDLMQCINELRERGLP